jgi:hypothetical protein
MPIFILTMVAAALAQPGSPVVPASVPSPTGDVIRAGIRQALATFDATDKMDDCFWALTELKDQTLTYVPATDVDAFVDAAVAWRLVAVARSAPEAQQLETLAYLRSNPEIGRTLVMLMNIDDKPAGALRVLDALRKQHGDALSSLPALVAAICVVHDDPRPAQVNENRIPQTDPMDVYAHIVMRQGAMKLDPRTTPAEMLTWVVDLHAPVDEINWAFEKYRGKPVGPCYSEIQYDTAHYKRGEPKKIAGLPYTLRNIKDKGGVCADQAYFSSMVGRIIGVPTVYVRGASGEGRHAWLGYLESGPRRAVWNFDTGRYDGYENVRGNVIDPQTRQVLPDSVLNLRAAAMLIPRERRLEAIALIDAAERIAFITPNPKLTLPGPPADARGAPALRAKDTRSVLELLEAGLRRCPTYDRGWRVLEKFAKSGMLSLEEKQRWAGLLNELCGKQYPDFVLDIQSPMIATVEDPKEKAAMWDRLAKALVSRPDLVAEVRFRQGSEFEEKEDYQAAWKCYHEIVTRLLNDGPFGADAVAACERLLRRGSANAKEEIVTLYASAWRRSTRPATSISPEFRSSSNWVRIGARYAEALQAANRGNEAAQVRKVISAD